MLRDVLGRDSGNDTDEDGWLNLEGVLSATAGALSDLLERRSAKRDSRLYAWVFEMRAKVSRKVHVPDAILMPWRIKIPPF